MTKLSIGEEIRQNIIYNFTNHFMINFPIWIIRKLYFKLRGMKIGKGSYILRGTVVLSPRNIVIGDRTYINENCFLDGRSGIKIGNDVTIAVYSKLITGGHNIHDDEFGYNGSPIVIQDNAVVFADTVVLGGATIYKGTIIGAGSVVVKGKYGPHSLYGGNPCMYIRGRNSKCEYKQDYWHPILR